MAGDPKSLYQSVIMRHNRDPFGYQKADDAEVVLEAVNPLCGDSFKIYLEMEKDRAVRIQFHGYGCAISKASTSVLVKRLTGMTKEAILRQIEKVQCVADPACALPDDLPEELLAFAAARDFPGRKTCVTLSWDALADFISQG